MTRIEELLAAPSRTLWSGRRDIYPNPLTADDALQEAQVLAVRFDALTLSAGVLFDLRMALQLREPNTGLLVADGVHELAWAGPGRPTTRTAWTVGGSRLTARGSLFGLDLGLWPSPGAQLHLVAESAAFFVGDVPSIGDTPPDYMEDDEESIRAGLAHWDSSIDLSGAAFVDRRLRR